MITVSRVLGNADKDRKLAREYQIRSRNDQVESIKISRLESQRIRMRKVSDKGTDIAITLDQGSTLKHNDVILMDDSKMILAKIEPEDVAMIEVKDSGILNGDDEAIAIALRIGHTIGNLHRPIKIEGKKVFFPIQTEGEIDTFRKLLHHVVDDHIEIKRITMVFEPDEGAEVHEH